MAPIAVICFFAVVGTLVWVVGRELTGLVGLFGYFATPLAEKDRALIHQHSPYYRRLSPDQQREFNKRVKHFLFEKEWIGKGIDVTREMRVRIAATATELTMGFDRLLLLHFSRILVYPDAYEEQSTGQRHLGGTMPGRRTIALSWKHFVEGAEDPSDARHVGLHELAHALWLENRIPNGEDDFLDQQAMEQWRELAAVEASRIRRGEGALFRDYAATDQAEFFAVAVEYFFEQPVAFQEKLPELYSCMCRLLKQDPASAGRSQAG